MAEDDATQGALIRLLMAVTWNVPRKHPANADLLQQITGIFFVAIAAAK